MVSRAQQLLKSGFQDRTVARVTSRGRNRGRGDSGAETLDDEADRIESYIKPEYLEDITNIASARKAARSLTRDSNKGFAGNRDFSNLLRNVGDEGIERFARHLYNRHWQPFIDTVKDSSFTLRSGKERTGIQISKRTYAIVVKNQYGLEYVQARDYKTGRTKKYSRLISFIRNFSKK